MFPSQFRHREDTLDIRLAVSRDGAQWTRPDREAAFIPLGQPANFDGGSLYMGNGGCLPTGDELSFYFSGSALKHGEVELENLADPTKRRVISRAVARPNRLVSVTAGVAGGQFNTPSLRFTGDRLILNATARPAGSVRIGLLDSEGRSIPGRSLDECQPLTGDNESWTMKWADRDHVAKWSTQPIRLQIELRDADLFGFQFIGKT